MPVTKRAAGSPPDYATPDYQRAMAPIERLGLDHGDPAYQLARFVVRRGRTDQTARQYGWVLARALAWFAAEGIAPLAADRDDLLYWWNHHAGLSPAWQAQQLLVLRSFYREAIERELIVRDPTRAIATPPRQYLSETPALTLEQATQLIDSIGTELDHPDRGLLARRDLAIVGFMLRLCLREGEVEKLRWRMFSEQRGERTVAFVGKWHHASRLIVPPDVDEVLARWKAGYERETGVRFELRDPLFVGLNPEALKAARERRPGEPLRALGRPALYEIVARRLADIGIVGSRFGPHCLRATGATLAHEAGADLLDCQALLRHESVETTRRFYIKRVDALAKPAIAKMPIRMMGAAAPEDAA